jgi:Fe2+ or Zn2+ uptake regulation protein
MLCKKFNFAELPDLKIILDGEIYLIALSFDLFKEKNDSHVYFKILLNGDNTKEYWYLGDPIIKHYNLLFDYTQTGKETITIVQSDKYESLIIILFFCVSSFITLLFYLVLIIIRVRKINQDAIDFQDNSPRKEEIKIQRMIKNQNDFEIPDENATYDNMSKNNFSTDEKKVKNNLEDIEEETFVERYNINNDLSVDFSDNSITKKKKRGKNIEKEDEIKYQTKKRKKNDIEIEMINMTEKGISSDEEDDLNIDDEGGIQPLNHRKLKDQ